MSVELVERYRDNADYRQLIDNVQEKFECCGVTEDGYKDWNQNIYFNCSRYTREDCQIGGRWTRRHSEVV